jgi:hypothetical protein
MVVWERSLVRALIQANRVALGQSDSSSFAYELDVHAMYSTSNYVLTAPGGRTGGKCMPIFHCKNFAIMRWSLNDIELPSERSHNSLQVRYELISSCL